MNKKNWLLITITLTVLNFTSTAFASITDEQNHQNNNLASNKVCADPAAAILKIMDCIENKKAFCAGGGYSRKFKKFHNDIDTNTGVPGNFFWLSTFFFVTFDLEYDLIENIGENKAELKYVEEVRFKDGDVFYQTEHAYVTVDSRCKMTLWDQYGDDAEQKAVEDKADSLKPF